MRARAERRKPSIRTIAQRVGLSPTTVSLALRGAARIPAPTRARVLAAARELGYIYRPRSEQVVRRRCVFVMPDTGDQSLSDNPFFGEVLRGAQQACDAHGARLSFCILPYEQDAPLPPVLHDAADEGVLLVGAYPASLVERIAGETGRALVLVDNRLPGRPYDSVMADDYGGALQATRHLIELGHRSIAMLAGRMDVPSFAERYRGYASACQQAGLRPWPPIESTWERHAVVVVWRDLLRRIPRPTACFCAHDAYAVLVLDVLRELGLAVPDDIALVGFDDFAMAAQARPALTTVRNHPRLMGRWGIERLLARLAGDDQPALAISIATQLVIRESTQRVR
ncbi:LacI family DNA-binding transcriptional regulator [Kallotenue papyrolyticum]|uniref:LacI family DNA-binding transcriptional regulator n=1 Tax=Kallotenue papyrolyticum TaxID=1325125 RepID=UPI0013771109|nr:LacI family DNA-binding transcriptional regulator [Kallotenue papyrolyticum]